MSDMKCPFCQQELECCGIYIDGTKKLLCDNCGLFGDNRLFEELIRTRKQLVTKCNQLEIAVDALKLFDSGQYTPEADAYGLKTDASRVARKTLEQITALEQKEG